MKNILVFNVNWVGDVIFTSPIFKALKQKYPDSKVTCLAPERVSGILKCITEIDEVISFDERGKNGGLLAKFRMVFRLKAKEFDSAFLLKPSLTRALMLYLAGIPIRVGLNTKNGGRFLTHKIEPLPEQSHRADQYIHIIESFGIPCEDRISRLEVKADAKKEADQMLKNLGIYRNDFVVIINPGGNWSLKRWPAKNFNHFIRQLLERREAKVIITGASKDIGLANEVSEHVLPRPINLAGKTNLHELVAIMDRADLVVSADSGPSHIANSVGTPLIDIFGPTRPEITAPRGKGRIAILQKDVGCNKEPCYHLDCQDNICMQSITVEDVLNASRKFGN